MEKRLQLLQSEIDNRVYDLAIEFLLSFPSVTPEILERHITPSYREMKPDDITGIYMSLLDTVQNRNMMSSVIGKAIGGIDNLGSILEGFNPCRVIAKYGTDWKMLLDEIIEKLEPVGKIRRTARSQWPQFCQGVISSAEFLKQFNTSQDFYDWIDHFDQDDRAREDLPDLLSNKVYGLGFALACGFLKDLGFYNFGKPDVHLKKIFYALNLSATESDRMIFKAITRIARHVDITPFKVDKVFWLIGSGNFHLDGLKISKQRNNFIKYVQERL